MDSCCISKVKLDEKGYENDSPYVVLHQNIPKHTEQGLTELKCGEVYYPFPQYIIIQWSDIHKHWPHEYVGFMRDEVILDHKMPCYMRLLSSKYINVFLDMKFTIRQMEKN